MEHRASTPPTIVGDSPAFTAVLDVARRAATTDAKVLITGESGVGKELVAHEVHYRSRRAACPLVAVNCAGLTETLLESELFGHAKGAFTGAYRDKPGKLELAHGGTLFLDEVGEMSLRMQALLLRFLENGEVQRVGGTERARRVDTRVVAVTNRNLLDRVANGEFREDLLFRLRVVHIHVPPLRERISDVPALVAHFASRAPQPVRFTPAALDLLCRYTWPGNVRELHNAVERLICERGGAEVGPEHLPECIRRSENLLHRERRRRVSDDLYDALTTGGCSFWAHIYPLFLSRDVTRQDIRDLICRGLQATRGNYRALLELFGMPPGDYQRFYNFLTAHDCRVEFREFRGMDPLVTPRVRRQVLPPVDPRGPGRPDRLTQN